MNKSEETIYDKIESKLYELIIQRVKRAKLILDIGCGECKLVNILAKRTKSKIFGVDINDSGFANGISEAQDLGVLERIKFIKVDAKFLTTAIDKKFDAVVSVYALHEYEKPDKVLQEVHRALKSGGKIVIVDFLEGSTAEELWNEDYYTEEQITDLLQNSGFKNLETIFPEGRELVLIEGMKLSH